MVADARELLRFTRRLRALLRAPVTAREGEAGIAARLAAREDALVAVLEHGVLARPRSPYRHLLAHAGAEAGDVRALVAQHGVEGALGRLHDAGVRVSLSELKGQVPIVRGSLELTVAPGDFDNPLAVSDFTGLGGGTTAAPRRLLVDLDALRSEAAVLALWDERAGLTRRPLGQWRAAPPGLAGIKDVLRKGAAGRVLDRWFTPAPLRLAPANARNLAFLAATRAASRSAGRPIPRPEHVPLDRPEPIARWLAALASQGRPAWFNTTASAGVRVCLAARAEGLDLEGTALRLGGEPFTAAREAVVRSVGARAVCHYSLSEVGKVGIACGTPAERDDVHLLTDRLAVAERGGRLHLTTLLASSPKLLLNAETGDRATLERRPCGCPLGAAGLDLHASAIRGVDKLTSEGMGPLGEEVVTLVDEVLPGRFGGAPTDWQLQEDGGTALPGVAIVASERVGPLDEAAVVETVLEALAAGEEHRRMTATLWRDAGTLRVERREPQATGTAKVPALLVSPPADPPSRAG